MAVTAYFDILSQDLERAVVKAYFITFQHTYQLRWSRDSMLAFSTQVCGFKPGRSRCIFRAKKSSARLLQRGSKAVGPMS